MTRLVTRPTGLQDKSLEEEIAEKIDVTRAKPAPYKLSLKPQEREVRVDDVDGKEVVLVVKEPTEQAAKEFQEFMESNADIGADGEVKSIKPKGFGMAQTKLLGHCLFKRTTGKADEPIGEIKIKTLPASLTRHLHKIVLELSNLGAAPTDAEPKNTQGATTTTSPTA